MAYQMTYYVKLKRNTPYWKKWLMNKSSWYEYNYAWKQPMWVVYDMVDKREIYPGGLLRQQALNNMNKLEDLRRNLIL